MGIYMPVQSESPVRFADEGGIHVALGIDKMFEYEREYEEKITIPAGLIRMSNGTRVRVYLDKRYVLGPEGAHVNIAGISGLATKTSYAMFLIQSILQTVGAKDIAVVLLNVKQNDLLVIDKPRRNPKPEDIELWEFLGLRPQPFENVRYLLPWAHRGRRRQQDRLRLQREEREQGLQGQCNVVDPSANVMIKCEDVTALILKRERGDDLRERDPRRDRDDVRHQGEGRRQRGAGSVAARSLDSSGGVGEG